jgi:outer membrane immunogenic protein
MKFFAKKILIALAGFTACLAAPAAANDFGGVYVQGTTGVEDVTHAPQTSDVTYGANAGVNIPVGNAIIGVEATLDNVFDRSREIGASARLGYAFGPVMPYVEAGYTNYKDAFSRKLDGLRVGGGLEYNISNHTYVSAEYRYTDFEDRVGKHAGLVGLGLRF